MNNEIEFLEKKILNRELEKLNNDLDSTITKCMLYKNLAKKTTLKRIMCLGKANKMISALLILFVLFAYYLVTYLSLSETNTFAILLNILMRILIFIIVGLVLFNTVSDNRILSNIKYLEYKIFRKKEEIEEKKKRIIVID